MNVVLIDTLKICNYIQRYGPIVLGSWAYSWYVCQCPVYKDKMLSSHNL